MSGAGTGTKIVLAAGTGPGLVLGPATEPISLSELKLHLRIEDTDTTEDTLLNRLIKAARGEVESITRRAIITQTWDYCLNAWPDNDFIVIPGGNLQSVTSVKYLDTDGVSTTMVDGTDYLVETNGQEKGRIVLPYGWSWPSTILYPSNPITIRYIAGWTAANLVPSEIGQAMLMICADMYEQRGEPTTGVLVTPNRKAVDRSLGYNLRLWE